MKSLFRNHPTKYFSRYLKFLNAHKLYPAIRAITGASITPVINIKGKKYITFSSNNYLSLANDKHIIKEVIGGLKKYGVGSGSTRLLSGTLDIQVEFEKSLSHFFKYDDSITFSSGYLANVGVIRSLVDTFPYFSLFQEHPGVIISDTLNHASIIDGVRLAKAERVTYAHNDMAELEHILQKYKSQRKLVVTDGIFSMDGDLANLKEITKLTKEHDALLMVDDSHGVGVLGPHGEGTAHHLGVHKDVTVLMGSFTKAFGSIGGFISTQKEISDYLRITARSYIFSDPILPAIVAGLLKSVEIIKKSDKQRKILLENAQYLRENLKKLGFTVLGNETPIIPVLTHSEEKAIRLSNMLFERGILAPAIRRPAVVEGKERIRLSLMANHTRQHVDNLLEEFEVLGKKLKII